jgi:competence protein ComGC
VFSLALRKGSEWTPIYMLVVLIIAVVVIATLVKPALATAAQRAKENADAAAIAAGTASILLRKSL